MRAMSISLDGPPAGGNCCASRLEVSFGVSARKREKISSSLSRLSGLSRLSSPLLGLSWLLLSALVQAKTLRAHEVSRWAGAGGQSRLSLQQVARRGGFAL